MYSAVVRLGKELHGCVPLLGAFVSDIVAGPNPMRMGNFCEGSVKSSTRVFARSRIVLVSDAA
jgi:hypothetical protein